MSKPRSLLPKLDVKDVLVEESGYKAYVDGEVLDHDELHYVVGLVKMNGQPECLG